MKPNVPSRVEASDAEFEAYLRGLARLSAAGKRKRLLQIEAAENRKALSADMRLRGLPSHGGKFGEADFNSDDIWCYSPAYGSVMPSERLMKGKAGK